MAKKNEFLQFVFALIIAVDTVIKANEIKKFVPPPSPDESEHFVTIALLLPGFEDRFDLGDETGNSDESFEYKVFESSSTKAVTKRINRITLLERVFEQAVSDEMASSLAGHGKVGQSSVKMRPLFIDGEDEFSDLILAVRHQESMNRRRKENNHHDYEEAGYSYRFENILPIVAMVGLSETCTFHKTTYLKEFVEETPGLSVISTCPPGVTSQIEIGSSIKEQAEAETGVVGTHKNVISDAIDGASVASLIEAISHRFHWHRFHFILTPHWEPYEELFVAINNSLAERGVLVLQTQKQQPENNNNDNNNGDFADERQKIIEDQQSAKDIDEDEHSNNDPFLITLTKSFFCTSQLETGNLCSLDRWFKSSVVNNQATVFFLLLEPTNDLPRFVDLLKASLAGHQPLQYALARKAIFVLQSSGFVDHDTSEMLRERAPPGLMVVTAKQPFNDIPVPFELPSLWTVFSETKNKLISTFSNNSTENKTLLTIELGDNDKKIGLMGNIMSMNGIATVLYNKMRVLTQALNQLEQHQSPGIADYNNEAIVADFYCGSTFTFGPATNDSFRFDSKSCARTWLNFRIYNAMELDYSLHHTATFPKANDELEVTQLVNLTLNVENDLNDNYYEFLYHADELKKLHHEHSGMSEEEEEKGKEEGGEMEILLVPVFDFINDAKILINLAKHQKHYSKPIWLGNLSTPPVEDACFYYFYHGKSLRVIKNESQFCRDQQGTFASPLDVDLIVEAATGSFALLLWALIVIVFVVVNVKRKRRRRQERFLAQIVAKFDEINFLGEIDSDRQIISGGNSNQRELNRNEISTTNDDSNMGGTSRAEENTPSQTNGEPSSSAVVVPSSLQVDTPNNIDILSGGGRFGVKVGSTSKTGPSQQQSTRRQTVSNTNGGVVLFAPVAGQMLRAKFHSQDVFVTLLKKSTCNIGDEEVLAELKQVRQLHHVNINKLIAVTTENYHICIIQEYCSKGTLASVLSRKKIQLDRLFKLSFASDIAAGMLYLHQSPVESHGRLTSNNILVDSRWFCKIADISLPNFEMSEAFVKNTSHSSKSNASRKEKFARKHSGPKSGRPRVSTWDEKTANTNSNSADEHDEQRYAHLAEKFWTAPEMLRCENAPPRGSQKADIYSFGIVLYELITRQKPYKSYNMSNGIIYRHILHATYPAFRPNLNTADSELWDLAEIARMCWDEVSAFRPDFASITKMLCRGNKGKATNLIDQMMAMMENYANNLEGEVIARTAELDKERLRSEELLTKMLPKSVVEDLKAGRVVRPETYESVTVYFSDIVGFIDLASGSSPLEIVDFLNDLYSTFDTIIDMFDVYKVETIGDAYMVGSGLPIRNGMRHVSEIATLSLEIMSCVTAFKVRHRPGKLLQLRIGMHSGSVVAGIIGLRMPRYCLFGDTVNYASRMESSGLALRIHVSPESKALLDQIGGFHLVKRGLVAMKGKGTVETYHLIGKDGWDKSLPDLKLAASIEEHEFK